MATNAVPASPGLATEAVSAATPAPPRSLSTTFWADGSPSSLPTGVAAPAAWTRKVVNLAYDDGRARDQNSSSATDSTGPSVSRFLSTSGDVSIDRADLQGGGSRANGALPLLLLDWIDPDTASLVHQARWTTIRNARIDEFTGRKLTLDGFVDVRVDLDTALSQTLAIFGAKRGAVEMGGGNDFLRVVVDSESASLTGFAIDMGAGDDRVGFEASIRDYTASWPGNAAYQPSWTRNTVELGSGNDQFFGNAGIDTLVYQGDLAQFAISVADNRTRIEDLLGNEGVDLLWGANFLQFGSGEILARTASGWTLAGSDFVQGRVRDIDVEAFEAKRFIADWLQGERGDGSWIPPEPVRPGLRDNAELRTELQQLDAASGALRVEVIGTSLSGNRLHAATIGTGDTHLLFLTQQHGDEPIGTEAAMLLLGYLTSNDPEVAGLLADVTVTVVPRVNPDGFARWQADVAGARPATPSRFNDRGIDLNRTYDPSAPFGIGVAPESVAVRNLVERLDPDLLVDYHNQLNYRSADGKLDTMSVLWPTNAGVDPNVVTASKRAVVALAGSLDGSDYDQLTRYPGGDGAEIARNGFALRGVPSILVEQRFGEEMYQLSYGLDLDYDALTSALAIEGFLSMRGLVRAASDGSLATLDPALADTIPGRSPFIPYRDVYADDPFR